MKLNGLYLSRVILVSTYYFYLVVNVLRTQKNGFYLSLELNGLSSLALLWSLFMTGYNFGLYLPLLILIKIAFGSTYKWNFRVSTYSWFSLVPTTTGVQWSLLMTGYLFIESLVFNRLSLSTELNGLYSFEALNSLLLSREIFGLYLSLELNGLSASQDNLWSLLLPERLWFLLTTWVSRVSTYLC